MKKKSKLLFAYFSLFTMLVGFFLPNFTYVVNATEVDANDNLLKSGEVTFSNVTDGVLYLGIEKDRSKDVVISNSDYEITSCYATDYGSIVEVNVSEDRTKCTVEAINYGLTDLVITYKNKSDLSDSYNTEVIRVDVEFEKYFNYVYDKLPDTVEYYNGFESDLALKYELPYHFSTSASDGYCGITAESSPCVIELAYEYYQYAGANPVEAKYTKTKEIEVVENDFNNDLDVTFEELYLNVGEEREFDSYTASININDYFWVSSDNSVAKVTSDNKLVGVSEGFAVIQLVHKDTLETYLYYGVEVSQLYAAREIDQVLNTFTDTVEIDISNNLGIFEGNSLYYEWSVINYFNTLAANASAYANSVTCAGELTDCQIEYTYTTNTGSHIGNTQLFDIKYNGVYVESTNAYYSFNDVYFTYNNSVFDITNILASDEYKVSYDEDYLTKLESETLSFEAKKEGFTTISLYIENEDGSGYKTDINLYILFTEADVNEANDLIDSLLELVIPFSSKGITTETMTDLYRGIIENALINNSIYPYLQIEVDDLPDDNFALTLWLDVYGYTPNVVSYYGVVKNGVFSDGGEEIYPEVEKILGQVKNEYKLTLDETLLLMNNSETLDDLFNEVLKLTGLNKLESNKFVFNYSLLGTYSINNYLYAGTMFSIELEYDNMIVARKDFFVQYDFIFDRDVTADASDESKLSFINAKLKDLEIDAEVEKAVDNYYLITGNNFRSYVLLDQKDKITAENVYLRHEDTSLKIGESVQLDYILLPFGSTYADVTFESSNPNVVKVSDKGVITGVSKGIAFVKMITDGEDFTILVTVGYDDNSFFDEVVKGLNLSYEVPYSLYYDAGDVKTALYDLAWDDIYSHIQKLKGGLSSTSTYGLNSGNIAFSFVSDEKDPSKVYLQFNSRFYTSELYPVEYEFVGIDSSKRVYDLDVNETVDMGLTFTEGDNINLRYSVLDSSVVSVTDGVLKGLKPGRTYVTVFDKYNKYSLSVPVTVSLEEYVATQKQLIEDTFIQIKGSELAGINFFSDYELSNFVLAKLDEAGIDYNVVLGEYDYLSFDVYFEENVKINVKAILEGECSESFEVLLAIDGLYFDGIYSIVDENDSFMVEPRTFGNAVDAEITSVSKNTDICTVNGLEVTGVKAGICELVFTVNGDSVNHYVIVNQDGINAELNELVSNLPDEIDVNMEPYDSDKARTLSGYFESYVMHIASELLKQGDFNAYHDISVDFTDVEDEVTVRVEYYRSFTSLNGNTSGRYYDYSSEKTIKVNFLGNTEAGKTAADKVLENVKSQYTLSLEQLVEFSVESGDYSEVYKYSDVIKDVKSVCEDCTLTRGPSGWVEPENGIITPSFVFILSKGEEPVATFDTKFVPSVIIDTYDIKDDQYIKNELKRQVEEAYKKYKENSSDVVNTSTIYNAKVTMLGLYKYNVEIDNKSFDLYVDVNILTKDLVYDVAIKDFTLDKEILNLEVGEGATIKATVNPTNTTEKLVWSSSDEKVAKVEDGRVTAIGSGNAVITVQTPNGKIKKTVPVSVIDPKVTGDIDGDGKVNIVDLVQLRKHLAGITTLKGDSLKGADVNKDGKVNILDLVKIRKHLAGLEEIK